MQPPCNRYAEALKRQQVFVRPMQFVRTPYHIRQKKQNNRRWLKNLILPAQ